MKAKQTARVHNLCMCLGGMALLCSVAVPGARGALPIVGDVGAFQDSTPGDAAFDSYGWAVTMEGNLAIVGMQGSVGSPGPPTAAFVYRADTQELLRTLVPPTAEDSFGSAVAISGNLAVVGARFEDVQTPSGMRYNAGAAHVYDLTTGQHVARLVANDPGGNSFLGEGVAIQGTTVLVGGRAGAAYMFDALTGEQLGKLTPSTPTGQVGGSMAIYGTTALISANSDESQGEFSGAAYVFDLSTRSEIRKIVPTDAAAYDNFGLSVDLEGNIAVIGSVFHDGAFEDSGAAYVFDITTGAQLQKLLPPEVSMDGQRQNFAATVSIDEHAILVGAPIDNRHGFFAGSSFLFDAKTFQPLAELVPGDMSKMNEFGSAVSLGGGYAVVADRRDDLRGTIYLFDISQVVVAEPASGGVALVALLLISVTTRRRCAALLHVERRCAIEGIVDSQGLRVEGRK